MKRGSPEWKKLWWGNRTYTIAALDGAATLAFTRLLGGKEEYGQLAKRILLDCAEWDPQGATGYRYNDEAGMPYAYYFSRTYTFVHDLLTEERARGLPPRHDGPRSRDVRSTCARGTCGSPTPATATGPGIFWAKWGSPFSARSKRPTIGSGSR